MIPLICLVLTLLSSVYADMAGECSMAGFYLELGCTPLPQTDNSTICPDAFDCPDLRINPDPNTCYYRGVSYKPGSSFPQNIVKNPCTKNCHCSIINGTPQFSCAVVDCVEAEGHDECILTYEADSCCSTGTVCGKDAIASLKTCEVDGVVYKEGQTFKPVNTQKTCACTAQWNGRYDDPTSCRDLDCAVEIHYQDMIFNKCAPVFFRDQRGCPISFVCPTDKTKVIRGLNTRGVSSQCYYGNMTVDVGDAVTVQETCTKCVCDVPPYVSCTMKGSCDD
ncbi:uncharacterized protein LOC112050352 [Bicyclus anynana]|uniref:Uncharacterized protein LOC112050352 n=1 Tax=Bicyclus anynana TaxID=110368 RepID=A0A6J1NHC6_BICAN|nr:uncharacterized protein LOC112050352 [Bicyclus anynana]